MASPHKLFVKACESHRAGRLDEAGQLYRKVLALDGRHFDSLHLLGLILLQQGRYESACDLFGRALALKDQTADIHLSLGLALHRLNRVDEAIGRFQRALALKPDAAEAHDHLSASFLSLGRWDEAEASARRALALKADVAGGHNHLGMALLGQGRLEEAEASCRRGLRLTPEDADAHRTLGDILQGLGRLGEAVACYRQALALTPDDPRCHNNLSAALLGLDRLEDAEASARTALALKPELAEARSNLANGLQGLGRWDEALVLALAAVAAAETDQSRALFARAFKGADGAPGAPLPGLPEMAARAVSEGWGRPKDLARASLALLRRNPAVRAGLEPVTAGDSEDAPASPGDWAVLGRDRLLLTMLRSGPIPEPALERFLTAGRRAMLALAERATMIEDDALGFCCALAAQCFITEYLFSRTDAEAARADRLREGLSAALAAGAPVAPVVVATAAAYGPLHGLAGAGLLAARSWPDPLRALLIQTIDEPGAEAALRAAIPSLTAIGDGVSRQVKAQYEDSPYPRWTVPGLVDPPQPLDLHVRRRCPRVAFHGSGRGRAIDILIAGCGTGQHSIETARSFPEARILAIDLSRASLGYAARKTGELGITGIAYAEADLLRLGSLDRRFDLIESVGVLHHLEDPMTGWRILLGLLRPGGFMRLGFYSEIARRSVVAARAFIARRGYGRSADDIRRCRQEMMADRGRWDELMRSSDFYSLSDCRDLLFHVQEHRLTLDQIGRFIADQGLAFLGFDAEAALIRHYRQRFPEDAAATDLSLWNRFEQENPASFAGMYQFWVQKLRG
ncbi:MAG: tetratricopeptide repeat protein [Rhodospirillaceae bacterium]